MRGETLLVSVLRRDSGKPASAAVRIRDVPRPEVNAGLARSSDASLGTTTSPFGVSRRKFVMLSSLSLKGGLRS